MKYRRNKVKREHGIIEDALQWLEELSCNSEVNDIIPGVIEVAHSPEKGIVYKYETQTGCKLLLKSNGSVQEVFVVTKDPSFVHAWVQEHFPISEKPNKSINLKTKSKNNQTVSQELDKDEVEEQWISQVLSIRRNIKKNKKRKSKQIASESDERGFIKIDKNLRNRVLEKWSHQNSEDNNIGDLVDPKVHSALQDLKAKLEDYKKPKKQ